MSSYLDVAWGSSFVVFLGLVLAVGVLAPLCRSPHQALRIAAWVALLEALAVSGLVVHTLASFAASEGRAIVPGPAATWAPALLAAIVGWIVAHRGRRLSAWLESPL